MTRWVKGERTVRYLIDRGRLESFEGRDLESTADALAKRAALRVRTTAVSALGGGDVDGAYVAAYDAYRMMAESLLARQGLRPASGAGSHLTVEDSVSAQFADVIPAFAKPTFERFRRTRHSAQYFDPDAAPITEADAEWAIDKATSALDEAQALLAETPPGRFSDLATAHGEPDKRPGSHSVVKSAATRFQPSGIPDRHLDRPSEALLSGSNRLIELVPVRIAQDEHVNVSDGPATRLPGTPGCPGTVDIGLGNPCNGLKEAADHHGHAESPR